MRCTTAKYEKLYARYLHNPGDLLDVGKLCKGERVLDLCGGTGATSVEALNRGAQCAVLTDLNPRCTDARVVKVQGSIEKMAAWTLQPFDLIICRQAIAYLNLQTVVDLLWKLLEKKGSRFVFNNFRRPRWGIRWYEYAGNRYLEVVGFVGNDVWHVQASPSIGADVSRFRWYSDREIRRAFANFQLEVVEKESTFYYTVRRSCSSIDETP